MKIYRGFPERLHHGAPHWVEPGRLFHIRIRLERDKEQKALTNLPLGETILDSAKLYEAKMRWHITLFLLMPDHVHAVLFFPRDKSIERSHSRLETLSYPSQSRRLGRTAISIIGCELTNAALSFQQS